MRKTKLILLIVVGVLLLLYGSLFLLNFGKNKQPEFGVTFSQKYADELGINWRAAFMASLEELNIKNYRLVAYWDLIEPQPDVYSFADLDWQIEQAKKHDAKVILAIGDRLPRWPECHWPRWTYQMSTDDRQIQVQELLKVLIERYKGYDNIVMWQVENEPFLSVFGECPKLDIEDFEADLDLVRSLDSRPIVITESGELSTWINGSKRGDYVGTSVYRVVWNKSFGYFSYDWLPASFYYLKAQLVKSFFPVKGIFISEMQMEPWTPGMPLEKTAREEQAKSMNVKQFRENLVYVKRIGLSPVYLWGVEWWYWLKDQGDASVWDEAKGEF
ncbi:MAG: beta-galactosidase [Patescibacteria group bacterium]